MVPPSDQNPMINSNSVLKINSFASLAEFEPQWNRMAKHPLQRTEWLKSWWHEFGADHDLCVLVILERNGDSIGYAPFYRSSETVRGNVLQFLGNGKACTDHASIICDESNVEACAFAIGEWLTETCHGTDVMVDNEWHTIDLDGIDGDDKGMNIILNCLRNAGISSRLADDLPTYSIDLPESINAFKKTLSKNGKRMVNQQMRRIASSDFEVVCFDKPESIEANWNLFVTLHQKRRTEIGDEGCFQEDSFERFLRNASKDLAARDLCELSLVKYQGQPIGMQLCFLDSETTYYYQSGLDPEFREHQPGSMMIWHNIQQSIERGAKTYDMMRGDESYKARWKAKPKSAVRLQAFSPSAESQLRKYAHNLGQFVVRTSKTLFATKSN